jgi:hypothetical protein
MWQPGQLNNSSTEAAVSSQQSVSQENLQQHWPGLMHIYQEHLLLVL